MLDFILSKMSWLMASVLVMSFIMGFYQIQTDNIDGNLLENTAQEIKRVISRLDGVRGEMTVNFTFDRYYSYRAIYLPGKVSGNVYKIMFTGNYIRIMSDNTDVAIRFGTQVQPMRHLELNNVGLEGLLENNTQVNKLTLYSDQDFAISSHFTEGLGNKIYVYLKTGVMHYYDFKEDGTEFLIGESNPPQVTNVPHLGAAEVNTPVNITADVTGENLVRVFLVLTTPDNLKFTHNMAKHSETGYYHKMNCPELGIYMYDIWVEDWFGRFDSDTGHSFISKDTTDPEIDVPIITPDPGKVNETVNVKVQVIDNYYVADVIPTFDPPGHVTLLNVIPSVDDTWIINCQFSLPGSYSIIIRAEDISGNRVVSDLYDFTIIL